jgi:hypothetical protein
MTENPLPFPRAGDFGVGGWPPAVKAYIDYGDGQGDAPGAPVPLEPIAPAIALVAYPSLLVPNGDGSVSLSGGVRVNTDPGGERRIFSPANGYLPATNQTHPVAAEITGGPNPGIITMGINVLPQADGGGIFLIFPEIPADAFALVWLDAVTYRPAPVG